MSTAGDSVFAVFPSALGAVGAAVAAQRALQEHPWPGGHALRVRMGMHTGEGVLGGDDYVGVDVHRTARISGAAHGGQVLLSGTTTTLLVGALPPGVAVQGLGEHHLKDLPEPEHLAQLVVDGLPTDFPPPRSEPRRGVVLPEPASSFVPRPEVEEGARLLGTARLLTLTGPGGTGKTRLAIEVGRLLGSRFRDGVAFAGLAAVPTPSLVAAAVADACGVPPGPEPARVRLLAHLSDRQQLVILDNFEHLLDAVPLVADILAAAADVRLLATSRAPLRLSGEQELPVPPLALPAPGDDLAAVRDSAAVRLFVSRAAAARPSFSVTAANAADVAEIVRRLDGLPLAVELAAARIRVLTAQAIADRLRTQGGLATVGTGARDLPGRQRTLRAVVDWSYRLLDPEVAGVFRRLAVFNGGAGIPQLGAVLGDGPEDQPLEALEVLVEHSLVRQAEDSGEPRFTLLETIREYAADRLEEAGERAQVSRRHADAFLSLAEAARPNLTGWDQVRWLDELDRERDNLRAALAWALEHDVRLALALGVTLSRYWRVRGNRREGAYWLQRTVAAAADDPDVDPAALFDARLHLGVLLDLAGEWDRAAALFAGELETVRLGGDDARLARTLNSLGVALRNCGDTRGAQVALDEAVRLRRRLGDPAGLASALTNLGIVALDLDEVATAIILFGEALEIDRRLDDPDGIAIDTVNLAVAQIAAGDLTQAAPLLSESVSRFVSLGDHGGLAYALEGCAVLAAAGGHGVHCARLLGASVALRDVSGEPLTPADERVLRRFVSSTEDGLGPAWTSALAEGRHASMATARHWADDVLSALGA
ncbi:MAG: tetratricopeptide repeat protein [Actinomycetia bacterium]|nr:tetratricopeptide repeat protein [Actinomycetes bacterium]